MTQKAIVDFFQETADRSPIPIIIYNFPGIVSGLDCNSDMLDTLSDHPNICGVKLTCGGVGKITRIAAKSSPGEFAAVCGQSDWLVAAMVSGAAGCISGVANIFPKVRLVFRCPCVSVIDALIDRFCFKYTICAAKERSQKQLNCRRNSAARNGEFPRQTLVA